MFQAYFQRVLSQKDPKYTPLLSVGAGVGCILMAVPAVLMGAVGASTGWKTVFSLYVILWYPGGFSSQTTENPLQMTNTKLFDNV